ncbi:MAG TPA: hypothetical protein DCS67_00575 [Clostridiales bacterium UBA8960]|jgi:hypothetical protein|nr:hypothetical protein [Clostridiales bacterium UBA8960]
MPISVRAKQFLPFDAVKGLREALKKKESVPEARHELSEELALELNEKMQKIQKGVNVTVTYYYIDTYIQLTGTVMQFDPVFRTLEVDETVIDIDDILDLMLEDE